MAELQGEIRELRAQLGQNAQNSSRLPPSDGPHIKRRPPWALSGRKRGGQPGHPAVQEARLYVQMQDTNVDETPWRQQQRRARLWMVVTQEVSVFCILASRGAKVL